MFLFAAFLFLVISNSAFALTSFPMAEMHNNNIDRHAVVPSHSTESSIADCYKITPSPNIAEIFDRFDETLDRCPAEAKETFKAYVKKMESFAKRNGQPFYELKMRLTVYGLLREAIEPYFNNGYLALGGSTLNRISTFGADLDLCFAIKSSEGTYNEDISPEVLSKIKHILEGKTFIANVRYVSARVPILKIDLAFPFQDIDVDINCNCVAGIFNSHLIYYYSKIDERFVQMNIILKQWGKVMNVISPRNGKINSYTMTLMIMHFLQCGVYPPILPNLYKLYPEYFGGTMNVEDLDYDLTLYLPDIPKNARTIGELLYGFMEYFSLFNYDNWWISIREGKLYSRSNQSDGDRQFLFYLEEAYDGMTVPKNLTRRYKLTEIVRSFQAEREVLLQDLFGNFPLPSIDTSYDYVCEDYQNGNG